MLLGPSRHDAVQPVRGNGKYVVAAKSKLCARMAFMFSSAETFQEAVQMLLDPCPVTVDLPKIQRLKCTKCTKSDAVPQQQTILVNRPPRTS